MFLPSRMLYVYCAGHLRCQPPPSGLSGATYFYLGDNPISDENISSTELDVRMVYCPLVQSFFVQTITFALISAPSFDDSSDHDN